METIPRNDFILRHRYDAFCKAVLRNEAKSYWSEMAHRREREKSLDALTQEEMDKLSVVDDYPSDSYVFSSYGYDLLIDNELVGRLCTSANNAHHFPHSFPLICDISTRRCFVSWGTYWAMNFLELPFSSI